MGNRGSINIISIDRYGKGLDETSVTLFRHWSGDKEKMIKLCNKGVKEHIRQRGAPPYNDEGEVIARLTKIAVEEDGNSAYLGKTENDGDNSDNGHFILYIKEDKGEMSGKWYLKKDEEIIWELV